MGKMKIVLSGVETNNKGAELMLYAILQEIERKWPEAEVYVPANAIRQGLDYVHTTLKLRYWPISSNLLFLFFNKILGKLRLHKIIDTWAVKSNYFLDGSGLVFSDSTNLWGTSPIYWKKLLYRQYKCGAKIVFLPQAFGPIERDITKQVIRILGHYASVIMPRDHVSFDFLNKSGLVDIRKVKIFTDFTSCVDGQMPSKYDYLKNGVCVIPNMRMIENGSTSFNDYITLISLIINFAKSHNLIVYLLNHEGKKDEELAYKIQKTIEEKVEVITNLNGIEVKGLISTAYAVISSRFHGVASALNSGVPCLATSWSHKYNELFKDFNMNDCIIPLDNNSKAIDMVAEILDEKKNCEIRKILNVQLPQIKEENQRMWNYIWNL